LRVAALSGILMSAAAAQVGLPELQLSDVELKNINAYAGMIRADLRKERRAIIGDSIGLAPALKDKFWAVYDRYEKDVQAVWDLRLANTKKYADHHDRMTDALADEMAKTFLKNEARLNELRSRYYAEFKAAVGPGLAARFLHVEGVLARVTELQMLAVVPLVP